MYGRVCPTLFSVQKRPNSYFRPKIEPEILHYQIHNICRVLYCKSFLVPYTWYYCCCTREHYLCSNHVALNERNRLGTSSVRSQYWYVITGKTVLKNAAGSGII